MSETVTEITSAVEKPLVKPKSTRGGYRPGGGRPRKEVTEPAKVVGSALPALPAARAGFVGPTAAFAFWKSLTETQLSKLVVYVNRQYPLCNAKLVDETAPKYIDVLSGPMPFDEPAGYSEYFFHKFGSGDYHLYFNEGSANRFRVAVTGLRDYDKYPPLIDWRTLLVNDPANKDFIRWAKTHGYAEEISKLQSSSTTEAIQQKEDEAMQIGMVEQVGKLTDTIVDMARENQRAAQQTAAPQAARSTAEERESVSLIKDAANTAIKMVEAQSNGSRQAADPMEAVKGLVELAKTMQPPAGNGDNLIVEILRDSLRETREELREIRSEKTQAAAAAAPKTFLEQMREMKEMKDLMGDVMGVSSSEPTKPEEEPKPTGIKGMVMAALADNAGTLISAIPGIMQSLIYGYQVLKTKPGEAPPPPPVATPPVQQQQNPQLTEQAQAEQELTFFFRRIEGAVSRHINDWENRDYPGADFAEWFIDSSLEGALEYEQLKNLGVENILGYLSKHPPFAKLMQAAPERFGVFVQQFFNMRDIRAKEEADESSDEEVVN